MKKMPTLFIRIFKDNNVLEITQNVTQGCEWVLKGDGVATRKYDGTCVMIKDNQIYARFDYKKGRKLPDNAIPCQEKADETTGHFPHWILVENQPQYKWHKKAFEQYQNLPNGTYELCGIHFQNNPEKIENKDVLIPHGKDVIEVKRDFESIKDYILNNDIEGIVFHNSDGKMCKIRKVDFGFRR